MRGFVWSNHIVFGLLLTLVFVGRVVWRLTKGRKLSHVGTPLTIKLAALVHVALYGLLAIVLGLGVANTMVRGPKLYGVLQLPQIGDPALKHDLTEWHGLAANILLALVVAHVAAALLHHFYWKDEVLMRMSPRS